MKCINIQQASRIGRNVTFIWFLTCNHLYFDEKIAHFEFSPVKSKSLIYGKGGQIQRGGGA